MVGDAVAVLDPLSSQGVLRALMSGMQAAHLSNLVLHKGIDERWAIQAYREWCLQRFDQEVGHLRELYARLPFPVAVPTPL
jgi:flavin-dependent dehydrogenase